MAVDPYRYFRLEARDLQDQLAAGILELEKGGDSAAVVQRLLRVAHTLKGAARVVKQQEIAEHAHSIEGALEAIRESPNSVDRRHIDAILEHIGDIADRFLRLGHSTETEAAQGAKPISDEGPRTVRADVAEMDAVLDGVLETHTLLTGLRTASEGLEQAQHLADILVAQLAPRGTTAQGRQTTGGPERLFSIAEELRRSFSGLGRNLGSAVDQMDRELRQLRDNAEQLRLVPAGTLFNSLERTARDTAHALSKQVVFEGTGGDLRLDSHVLATIQGALLQIVRNSVAHGIELPQERHARGKAESGRVSIGVSRRGRRIVFDCRDDGGGLDLDAVRRVASQRGLLAQGPLPPTAENLIRLLLRGGISTAADVTPVSGRGIGLDVVREALERLNGEVVVHTEPRRGTTIELIVPPSLASMEALAVEVSGTVASIPLDAVQGSLRVAAGEISQSSTGASIVRESGAIPFVPLSSILDSIRPPTGRNWTAVVITGARGRAAIGVDRLLGTSRIVVRPLPVQAPASPAVAGASLDAEGNPQLVLDPDGLIAHAHAATEFEPAPTPDRVLVVDDSLTTRMLEQSILESAGYDVDVALSAEEALESVRKRRYALILVDVEMPGMDGYTFIERLRADPALHDTPAILVTSRAAPEDRQRGIAVGAQGYVAKSEFDQAGLLAMIKRLVK
jgi:two-component system, chemotaxis family, sensor kinase CheA